MLIRREQARGERGQEEGRGTSQTPKKATHKHTRHRHRHNRIPSHHIKSHHPSTQPVHQPNRTNSLCAAAVGEALGRRLAAGRRALILDVVIVQDLGVPAGRRTKRTRQHTKKERKEEKRAALKKPNCKLDRSEKRKRRRTGEEAKQGLRARDPEKVGTFLP